jgi:iron complex transport system ATP-binding protein
MPELITRNLSINYDNRDVLQDVSISFSGGLNYILGLNGSGKSSFLKAIVGLVNYAGSIKWNSQELSTFSSRERARKIALLSQRLQLPFRLEVYEFVLMGRFPYLDWLGNYSQDDHAMAEQAMERMDLTEFRSRRMDQLSGGEFQRANLARALCQNSPVLLLDEPAQSLDPKSKTFLYQLLEKLAADHLLICTTHDLDYIKNSNARVVGLKDQKIVWDTQGLVSMKEIQREVYGIA